MIPRASGRQWGAPNPASAGTMVTPPVSGTDAASGFDLGGGLDDAQSVAQPLDQRARDEGAAFEGIVRAARGLPRHRAQQTVLRQHGPLAHVHEQERSGSEGAFGFPAREAALAEERGLLVPGDAGDGGSIGQTALHAIHAKGDRQTSG